MGLTTLAPAGPAWYPGRMKEYTGYRTPQGCVVTVHRDGEAPRPLDLRLDLRRHSPTGPEWGYSGSGPAQLALALAADVLGDDERAQDVYQQLKLRVVAKLPKDGWKLSQRTLLTAIDASERGRSR